MEGISRRRFLKRAIIMGAAITAFPTILVRKSRAAWAPGTVVHPRVNNLRVVGMTDTRMTKAIDPVSSWARQEALVVEEIVWENMDRLACALSETRNPSEAWQTIFIKPPRKSWSETVVAIKTNNIGEQHTRSAVIAKVCQTLTGIQGVKSGNIHIYDACHGSRMGNTTPFAHLPPGCRIEDRWVGATASTSLPAQAGNIGDKVECLQYLVDGTVDILINIAMCKGHSSHLGGFTMTMKNHLGTFSPSPVHQGGGLDYLIAINQTPEILGPMDKATGRVLFPRQQLCIVDALWASQGGPGGKPSHQPNFIAMGVLSPAVDYQVATRFRGERMGWRPNIKAAQRMLYDFGYKESDLPAGGGIIEV